MNCSVQSDLAQLKARQSDVRTLHPEDMMQDDVLVSTLLAQQPPPLTAGASAHSKNVARLARTAAARGARRSCARSGSF